MSFSVQLDVFLTKPMTRKDPFSEKLFPSVNVRSDAQAGEAKTMNIKATMNLAFFMRVLLREGFGLGICKKHAPL